MAKQLSATNSTKMPNRGLASYETSLSIFFALLLSLVPIFSVKAMDDLSPKSKCLLALAQLDPSHVSSGAPSASIYKADQPAEVSATMNQLRGDIRTAMGPQQVALAEAFAQSPELLNSMNLLVQGKREEAIETSKKVVGVFVGNQPVFFPMSADPSGRMSWQVIEYLVSRPEVRDRLKSLPPDYLSKMPANQELVSEDTVKKAAPEIAKLASIRTAPEAYAKLKSMGPQLIPYLQRLASTVPESHHSMARFYIYRLLRDFNVPSITLHNELEANLSALTGAVENPTGEALLQLMGRNDQAAFFLKLSALNFAFDQIDDIPTYAPIVYKAAEDPNPSVNGKARQALGLK